MRTYAPSGKLEVADPYPNPYWATIRTSPHPNPTTSAFSLLPTYHLCRQPRRILKDGKEDQMSGDLLCVIS